MIRVKELFGLKLHLTPPHEGLSSIIKPTQANNGIYFFRHAVTGVLTRKYNGYRVNVHYFMKDGVRCASVTTTSGTELSWVTKLVMQDIDSLPPLAFESPSGCSIQCELIGRVNGVDTEVGYGGVLRAINMACQWKVPGVSVELKAFSLFQMGTIHGVHIGYKDAELEVIKRILGSQHHISVVESKRFALRPGGVFEVEGYPTTKLQSMDDWTSLVETIWPLSEGAVAYAHPKTSTLTEKRFRVDANKSSVLRDVMALKVKRLFTFNGRIEARQIWCKVNGRIVSLGETSDQINAKVVSLGLTGAVFATLTATWISGDLDRLDGVKALKDSHIISHAKEINTEGDKYEIYTELSTLCSSVPHHGGVHVALAAMALLHDKPACQFAVEPSAATNANANATNTTATSTSVTKAFDGLSFVLVDVPGTPRYNAMSKRIKDLGGQCYGFKQVKKTLPVSYAVSDSVTVGSKADIMKLHRVNVANIITFADLELELQNNE